MMGRKTFITLTFCLAAFAFWWAFCLPDTLFDSPTSTAVFDRDDRLLGARIANDGQWRFPMADSVPRRFEAAILAYEDEGFHSHWGISPKAIVRAVRQNLSNGDVVSGASTITMQLMRMSGDGGQRTYGKKILEMIRATRAEARYSKAEILNLYASNAPFGGNVVGLEAASWRYFQKPTHGLTWAEATALAVLPNAPGLIYPGRSSDAFLKKRNFVLGKLHENGNISESTYELSLLEPLPDAPKRLPQETFHLTALINARRHGERVNTSVNAALQKKCNDALKNRLRRLKENHIKNAAVLVVDNQTGNVIAYVGNAKDGWQDHENANDMIQTPRSSGSILKPFLYAEMLEEGTILPEQLIPDIPTQYADFAPKNFDETFSGAVKADEALSRSLNIPAVRMLHDYGVDFFYDDLQEWGFGSVNRGAADYGLSLILGGAEIKLWDLVQAYRVLSLNCAEGVFSNIGYTVGSEKESFRSPVGEAASWYTLKALEEVTRPEERSAWKAFGSSARIAWKTGTSYGFRDAWAVGVTPEYTVGVWVGNANGEGRPGLTGLSAAAPMLFDVFNFLPGDARFIRPISGLAPSFICVQSGMRAGENCAHQNNGLVPESCAQNEPCSYCETIFLDSEKEWQVTAQCYPVDSIVEEKRFALPPLQEWFYMKRTPGYQKVPDYSAPCTASLAESGIRLIYPSPKSTVFLPREYDGDKEKIVFKAACSDPSSSLFWHLDENYCGSTSGIHHLELEMERGEHSVAILDENGREYRTRIRVD